MFVCWLVEGRYSGRLQFCTVLLKKHSLKREKEEKKRKKKRKRKKKEKKTQLKGADQKLYINVKFINWESKWGL